MTTPAERPGAKGRTPVKSAGAFRTISEVSIELEVPQHVLRFWETKFPQVRPLKRGGGRAALAGKLLLDMGYTDVRNLGGFKDWVEAGGEVDR